MKLTQPSERKSKQKFPEKDKWQKNCEIKALKFIQLGFEWSSKNIC